MPSEITGKGRPSFFIFIFISLGVTVRCSGFRITLKLPFTSRMANDTVLISKTFWPRNNSTKSTTVRRTRFIAFWSILPSFIIMYIVSLFYEQFMEITLVAAAFKGIQICVVYLIASAGLKMLKKMKKTPQNIIVFSVTSIGMILCTLFDIHISSVWFILAAGVLGLSIFFIKKTRAKGEKTK